MVPGRVSTVTSVSLRRTRRHSLKSSISTAHSARYQFYIRHFGQIKVCDENPTTKSGADNGTSIAFSLLQLYFNNQPTIQTKMIPMSSTRRAAVEFPIECSLMPQYGCLQVDLSQKLQITCVSFDITILVEAITTSTNKFVGQPPCYCI